MSLGFHVLGKNSHKFLYYIMPGTLCAKFSFVVFLTLWLFNSFLNCEDTLDKQLKQYLKDSQYCVRYMYLHVN